MGAVDVKITIISAVLALTCWSARAQELESLLPPSIPGYGTPFGVTAQNPALPPFIGFQLGGLSLIPELDLSQGYDSAPNGAAGSAVTSAAPSLAVANPLLGFGALLASNVSEYPENSRQNTSGFTLAAGECAVLPNETITLSTGYLNTQETGFALDTIDITQPIAFSVQDYRVSDELSLGLFALKPEASVTLYSFPGYAAQNRTDTREGLTGTFIPGGPVQLLLRLHSTQSRYREPVFNAGTNQLTGGLTDTADGLWTVSLLGGIAQRASHTGRVIIAPVSEARLDWMPAERDRVRLSLAREIDDPDEISASAYTLTQAKLAFDHELPSDAVFKFSARVSNAAYFHSALRETLYSGDAGLSVPLGPYLAVDGDYAFNDRQANYLRAANEHVVTLGVVWTP